MDAATTENTIFRFKFTPEFTGDLLSFSKLHQFDDRVTYKEAWTIWVRNNDDLIESECRRMKQIGYEGNVLDKMYKSGRYYFRIKKDFGERKKESISRKQYIALDNELIDKMDTHISRNERGLKPAICFEMFCMIYEEDIDVEEKRLFEEYDLVQDAYSKKIKKTYKNRCYQNKNN
jgi:hypothetical protein